MMSFVRGVLFGFERSLKRLLSASLGRHGGRLVVEMRDGDEVVGGTLAERGQPKARPGTCRKPSTQCICV